MTDVQRALAELPLPDEDAARARAWAAVSAAAREHPAVRRPSRSLRMALPAAAAAVLGALALSPAGATVGRLIRHALGSPQRVAARASLPGAGTLLVSGPRGTFAVAADGATRRLGPWTQAEWSPHGLYVAGAGPTGLAMVDPRGVPAWALTRPAVSDPRWFEPTGYRLAYLSHGALRVVAGDGSGDRLLAAHAAPVAPAWRPAHAYQVAYVSASNRLTVRDAGSGRLVWGAGAAPRSPAALAWSPGGARLLAVGRSSAWLYGAGGRLLERLAPGPGTVRSASQSPDGSVLALVVSGGARAPQMPLGSGRLDELVLMDLAGQRPSTRTVLYAQSLSVAAWSPDGRWLMVLQDAPERRWLLVRAGRHPSESLVPARLGRRLAALGTVRVDGWCCRR